jgi:ectoine hydroxylase-related dioxygenase (phytanoyl-CoA dioxygenase family)
MYTGRPIFDPAAVDLRDRRGAPLDPLQAFRADSGREDMAHFLRTAGYLLVKGVFSPDEVEAFRAAAQTLRERAREGDRKSWWGRDARGESVLSRVLNAGDLPLFRALHGDARIRRLVDLTDTLLVGGDPGAQDGVTVLWKNPGMTEGLGDLPWHHDCGLGGHAAMCPTLVCSIFLGPNTPEAGALHFLPGSWQSSVGFAEAGDADAPQGVIPPAEPGDLTLHYGDGKHAAPGPTGAGGPFRSCILLGFKPPGAHHHRGERHYNDVLLGSEDGQIEHMTRAARRSRA